VTGRGNEMRGYFNHFVPWNEVRGIEVGGFGSRHMRLDDTFQSEIRVTRRYGYGGSNARGTSGKMARLATIKIVRTNGRRLLLRAPVVTGWASDPYFTDKTTQLQQLCNMYAGPTELRSARRGR
jgi:hypothetical protein